MQVLLTSFLLNYGLQALTYELDSLFKAVLLD